MRYAISDIHGCKKTLMKALETVEFQRGDDLYVIGDCIDRGPDSPGVIDFLIKGRKEGFNFHVLMGNHEDFLLSSIGNPEVYSSWMFNGGNHCMNQYLRGHDRDYREVDMMNFHKFIPRSHRDFLQELPLYKDTGDCILVHAGLNFYLEDPLKNSSKDEMIWERYSEYHPGALGGRGLITGHTPRLRQKIEDDIINKQGHILIDGGCCFYKQYSYDYGNLVVYNMDTKELHFIRNCETNE